MKVELQAGIVSPCEAAEEGRRAAPDSHQDDEHDSHQLRGAEQRPKPSQRLRLIRACVHVDVAAVVSALFI